MGVRNMLTVQNLTSLRSLLKGMKCEVEKSVNSDIGGFTFPWKFCINTSEIFTKT